jgi:DNA-directed RNA polymerase subunit F
MILMTEKEFVDFATVRELLSDAQERRGDLSYEQMMALQHAEWAASTNRGGTKTDPKVFTALYDALFENEKLSQYPEICSKLAELTPLNVKGVRVIISSKRIAMDTSEVEEIITIIRQHVL